MSMRRVVVTGLGVVSPIGNDAASVTEALRAGRSGVEAVPEMAERGFRSQVAGTLKIDVADHVDKRTLRFMGPGAAYAHIAMEQAIADAGLSEEEVVNPSTGLIAGSGGPSTSAMFEAHRTVVEKGAPKRIGPFAVPKCMSSTVSANLCTAHRIKGVNFSITSACSTSLHCIGMAAQQVALGHQEIMFAGGGEELDWTLSCLFDAMGAMSSRFNDRPEAASRPYDEARDGFVIAGGGGMVILEPLERALARGVPIYAEVTGFGMTSDGADMVAPSGEGGARAMRAALASVGDRRVDYVNAHGTATPVGDVTEVEAVREVLGSDHPPIGSTKSLTGHSQGATGVHEVVYCLLMMRHGFLAPSINVEALDPALRPEEIVTEAREAEIDTVLSNSFGFGGTNAAIALSKVQD
jgi:3-oxoacyl-[acyl-carrier-protein] synthase-1